MSRSSLRLGLALTVIALLAATVGVASASATQLVTNGDFETGTLEGWHTSYESESAEWFTFSRKEAEESSSFFPPSSGEHAAVDFFGGPDSAILYQEVAIPAASTDQLSMYLGYRSGAPLAEPSPNTLQLDPKFEGGNQQLRVDVLRAGAPIRSLESADVLKTVFATTEASPEELEPTHLTADLSAFAGQTVVLRIANVVEVNEMLSQIDGVSIESTPIPVAPPVVVPPSNVFTKGKLTLNKKSGTGFLSVTVPDAGILTATDARRKIALASAATTKGKAKPLLIKTATVDAVGAETVKVPIKATPAGMKMLKKTGKLAFKLRLTFTPNGGTASTQAFAGKLAKKLTPGPK